MRAPLLIAVCCLGATVSFPASALPLTRITVSEPIVRVQAPATEAKLRAVLAELAQGTPNMSQFEPMLRVAMQNGMPRVRQYMSMVGPVQSIQFVGAQNGGDVYQVTFQGGVSAWWIQLAPNGNISGLFWQ